MIYGYCRISTAKQNIERQERNIKSRYPDAVIVKEVYTGTKFQGRKELEKILANVKKGDIIVFDSVSRMSRDADEGIKLYMNLYQKGIHLVFLKEGYINTEVYASSLQRTIDKTGNKIADIYIEATNEVLMLLAEEQIRIAFDQAEKEVQDLRQRTKEGIETARINGKNPGIQKTKRVIKKKLPAMKEIRKNAKAFGGAYKDKDLMILLGLSRNTYYKYKKEIEDEICNEMSSKQG